MIPQWWADIQLQPCSASAIPCQFEAKSYFSVFYWTSGWGTLGIYKKRRTLGICKCSTIFFPINTNNAMNISLHIAGVFWAKFFLLNDILGPIFLDQKVGMFLWLELHMCVCMYMYLLALLAERAVPNDNVTGRVQAYSFSRKSPALVIISFC